MPCPVNVIMSMTTDLVARVKPHEIEAEYSNSSGSLANGSDKGVGCLIESGTHREVNLRQTVTPRAPCGTPDFHKVPPLWMIQSDKFDKYSDTVIDL